MSSKYLMISFKFLLILIISLEGLKKNRPPILSPGFYAGPSLLKFPKAHPSITKTAIAILKAKQ